MATFLSRLHDIIISKITMGVLLIKHSKKLSLFLIYLMLLASFIFILPGCGGGGGGASSSGDSGESGGANNPPAENSATPDSTPTQTPSASQTPEPGNKGALIMITMPDHSATAVIAGVCDYPGEDNDLRYIAKDALDFKNALTGSSFWNGANIDIQNDIHVTKSKIFDAVAAARENTADDGLFIFFYSGHGTNVGSTGYIIPYDGAESYSNMISEYDLRDWLESFPALSKKYVALDACYSGNFIEKSILKSDLLKAKFMKVKGSDETYNSEKMVRSLVDSSNTYVFTSSKGSEVSWESYAMQNSVFVHYLCEGLGAGFTMGPADFNRNNAITAEEINLYVPIRVNNYVINSSGYYTQQPQSYDDCPGELRIK